MTRDELLDLLEFYRKQYNYAASSPWYRSTKSAIERLKMAEEASNAGDQFSNLWLAVNHLYSPVQRSGEEENKALSRWGSEIVVAPSVETSLRKISKDSLETIQRAESKLLYDFQQKRDREGKVLLAAWLKKYPLPSSLKAIQYLLGISRDCRNATFHANFDPSNRNVVKALGALVEVLEPFTRAAIEATIRHPIPGTTGRVPTYRGFLWPYFSNSNGFFSDYYLEELLPDQELGAFPTEETTEHLKSIGKVYRAEGETLRDADALQTAEQWLEPVLFPALDLAPVSGPKIVGPEGVYEPTYAITVSDHSGPLKAEYQGKAAGETITALIFVMPWSASLDGTWTDSEQAALQHVQEALRASDVTWAVLTNGQQLRLLRKETVIQARSFAEVDVTTILLRLGNAQDRDDAIRAFRYGRALFSGPSFTEADKKDQTRLERVLAESKRHGAELGAELKQNVFTALEHLGEGFRYYLETHPDEREALRKKIAPNVAAADFLTSEPLLEKIYEGSLALMYRLLFLFYAESRDLLPMDQDLYREEYSLESMRDEVAARQDSPNETERFVKGGHDLYERLKELFALVNGSAPSLVPAFNGGLFDPKNYWLLERCEIGDYFLAEAINLLSRTQLPWRTGLVKVTYRDLSVRHLGEIYEGILEYHAHIADEELVIVQRGSGSNKYEAYVELSELKKKERKYYHEWLDWKQGEGTLSRWNKVRGRKLPGNYFLVSGGRESKRKSSGSYYTPDYIVQYMVENTLGPLVQGDNREGELKDVPLTSDEILDLKVLDPAMGSGHFLVAALEYLARAYWEALNREGKDEDGVMSDEEYTTCKRRVAERCIYGVDLNPLAVELAKLSIWLTTMDPQRPLSFLNHHLKCGNSLLGAWVKDLGALPRSKTKPGQYNLFEHHFKARVPLMVKDVFGIMERETLSTDDIQAKKALDQAVAATKAPFVNIADAWVAMYFGGEARDYDALLTDPDKASERESEASKQHRFFHWELEFPEVWYEKGGERRVAGGFDAVLANPPYGLVHQRDTLDYLNAKYSVAEYQLDNYQLFWEMSESAVRQGALCCLITPSAWTMNEKSSLVRDMLLSRNSAYLLTNCSSSTFDNVTLEPLIALIRKKPPTEGSLTNVVIAPHDNNFSFADTYEVSQTYLSEGPVANYFFDNDDFDFMESIRDSLVRVDDYFDVTVGVKPYQTGKGKPKQTSSDVKNRIYDVSGPVDSSCRLYVRGSDFRRFCWNDDAEKRWIRYGSWLAEPRNQDVFDSKKKIIIRQTGDAIVGILDTEQRVCLNNCHTITHKSKDKKYPIDAALAQLNSSLVDLLFLFDNPERGEAFAEVKANKVKRLSLVKPQLLDKPVDSHTSNKSLRGLTIGEAFIELSRQAQQLGNAEQITEHVDEITESLLQSAISGRRSKIEKRILLPKGKA